MCYGVIFKYLCPHVYTYPIHVCGNCGEDPYKNFNRESLAKLCDGCQCEFDKLSTYQTGKQKKREVEGGQPDLEPSNKRVKLEQVAHSLNSLELSQKAGNHLPIEDAETRNVEVPKGQMVIGMGKPKLPILESPQKGTYIDPVVIPSTLLKFPIWFGVKFKVSKENGISLEQIKTVLNGKGLKDLAEFKERVFKEYGFQPTEIRDRATEFMTSKFDVTCALRHLSG